MAQITNTVSRFNINGVREDLVDYINNVSPEDTPVTSAAGTKIAENTLHEWQRDSLRTPNKDNAAIDGDQATPSAKNATDRIGNYCQIYQDTISTTRRANRVKKAGRTTEQKYQIAKAYKELQRDYEASVLSSNVAVAGNNTTASKMAGAGAMIYSNTSHGVGGSTTTHNSGAATTAPVAGTARAFAAAQIDTVVAATYTNSGRIPKQIFMSPNHKGLFSAFVGIAVNRYQVDAKVKQGAILAGADVYGSNFGPLTVVPHYVMVGSGTVFGLDTEDLDMAFLSSFNSEPLGRRGDSVEEQVIVDVTLRMNAEKRHFKIADLTP